MWLGLEAEGRPIAPPPPPCPHARLPHPTARLGAVSAAHCVADGFRPSLPAPSGRESWRLQTWCGRLLPALPLVVLISLFQLCPCGTQPPAMYIHVRLRCTYAYCILYAVHMRCTFGGVDHLFTCGRLMEPTINLVYSTWCHLVGCATTSRMFTVLLLPAGWLPTKAREKFHSTDQTLQEVGPCTWPFALQPALAFTCQPFNCTLVYLLPSALIVSSVLLALPLASTLSTLSFLFLSAPLSPFLFLYLPVGPPLSTLSPLLSPFKREEARWERQERRASEAGGSLDKRGGWAQHICWL